MGWAAWTGLTEGPSKLHKTSDHLSSHPRMSPAPARLHSALEDCRTSRQPSRCFHAEHWQRLAGSLGLPRRQLQIVQCALDGYDLRAIAAELAISEHTVHTHLNRLYKRTGVKSRRELVARVCWELMSSTNGPDQSHGYALLAPKAVSQ